MNAFYSRSLHRSLAIAIFYYKPLRIRVTNYLSSFFDLCGSATKCMTGKSLCEMRRCVYNSTQMLCLMASMDHSLHKMTGGLALILRSSWSRDIFLRALYTSLCVKEISCVKNRLGCRNLRRHSQLQTWWTQIFFFFALSISFLLVALVLPCGKPVGLSPCASKGTIYHLGLSRPVLNKTHDREIALRNARMRIYFDANLWDMPSLVDYRRVLESSHFLQ